VVKISQEIALYLTGCT